MSSNTVLDNKYLENLRKLKIISEQEIAIIEGDIVVAKNVLTDKKRILDKSLLEKYKINSLNENKNKELLKD